MKIPLIKPYIDDNVKKEVLKVLDSGFLTEGVQTREFENLVQKYIGCQHAIAVCNCTVGLEIALRAFGIGEGDEVIVPDYTYPATASVVNIVGADIVLIDVDPETMLIDYDQIEKAVTKKTRAIIPVSLFGSPLDYTKLNVIKEKYNLLIIEDAACSIGASFNDIRVGNLADVSVFSLHPRKFITTGEGGIVTTNNSKIADWMNSYKHFGMGVSESRLSTSFVQIGTNYKLSNIQAAVGLVQMKKIDELLGKRKSLANNYFSLLSGSDKVTFPHLSINGNSSFQSFCILVEKRDMIMDEMRKRDIEVQIGSYSLHMHQAFSMNEKCRIEGNLAGSKYAFTHCLALPMYHDMTIENQEYVVKNLLELLETD